MLALALALCPLLTLCASQVSAQESGARPAPRAPRAAGKAKARAGARARGKAAAKPKSTPAAEKPAPAAPAPTPERSADVQAGAPTAAETPGEVRSEGDTQVKVMEFSGLDIEGQLKTPQMLYFLNRLRAEFGRPRLPHRSFMPELQRGTQEQAQR